MAEQAEKSGREAILCGITCWVIENGAAAQERSTFNEFGLLLPIRR